MKNSDVKYLLEQRLALISEFPIQLRLAMIGFSTSVVSGRSDTEKAVVAAVKEMARRATGQ